MESEAHTYGPTNGNIMARRANRVRQRAREAAAALAVNTDEVDSHTVMPLRLTGKLERCNLVVVVVSGSDHDGSIVETHIERRCAFHGLR